MRSQVAQLILLESMLLAALGFVGGLGISWALLKLSARVAAKTMYHDAEIGSQSLSMAAAATFGAALLAALVPAFRATRVKPLEAMSSRPELSVDKPLATWTWLLGLALVALNPILAFFFPPRFDEGVVTSIAIGFVATAAGFVLLAPSVVVFVDRWLSPVLAKLFGVKPQLLASQLTSHLWRTVGAAISMAVGMGLYIAVQVWGYTMLDGFIVGNWVPDALLAFRPAGLTPEQVADVSKIAGIAPLLQTPVVVEQPRLSEDLTNSAELRIGHASGQRRPRGLESRRGVWYYAASEVGMGCRFVGRSDRRIEVRPWLRRAGSFSERDRPNSRRFVFARSA
ncbi:MAG: FtsX-like permease family protein [Pirellulales bacterium]